jgi:hypothetical protein
MCRVLRSARVHAPHAVESLARRAAPSSAQGVGALSEAHPSAQSRIQAFTFQNPIKDAIEVLLLRGRRPRWRPFPRRSRSSRTAFASLISRRLFAPFSCRRPPDGADGPARLPAAAFRGRAERAGAEELELLGALHW